MSHSQDQPTNRLGAETSAYLRQHMHNPVDWYPWGEEALTRARDEDLPILVSIGYSACHWCHVMERESFENPQTAELMNRGFVNIKVDREERPDVDQLYMDTVVRLNGHGGWPLTVFCTPSGKPFYGGTYFPPEPRHGMMSFPDLLDRISTAWRERRDEVDDSADSIVRALKARPEGVAEGLPGVDALRDAAHALLSQADRKHGGLGGAPKFPTATSLELLLAGCDVQPEADTSATLDFLAFTCREMSRRGLYDQLGGGFHRYCVDDHWGVPHFEKMLYDQGQLVQTYADVWRRTGATDEDLLWPIRETFEWLRREMTGPEGGWCASQDADSEGEEGKFYVWTPSEVAGVLGTERAEAFCRTYGVTRVGNFEHNATVLWDVVREPRERLAAERQKLLAARGERIAPATDTKRVAGWNALTASGFAYAGSLLEDAELLDGAAAACDFVLDRMRDDDGKLLRVFAGDAARIPAFLDDHAALLDACLALYRAGAGDRYLTESIATARAITSRFFDENESDFFLTPSDGERLPHRPRSDHDGAVPNSTGLAVLGLLRVASLTGAG
ncbi:MAG: thioredoxin domain-containing protein, partial [Myxococcales bacterium]|nr:thioredoxin domain-containing protein [Myxococcales bacterium]